MGFIRNEFNEVRKYFGKESLISGILLFLLTPIFLFLSGLPGVFLTMWFWDTDRSNYAGLVIKLPLNFLLIMAILAFLYFIFRRHVSYSDHGYYIEEISKIEKNKIKNKDWKVDLFRISNFRYRYSQYSLWTFYISYFLFCTWFVYFVWTTIFN